jgi:hypothetical protein
MELKVVVTDTQGMLHIYDKPTSFNITNEPFLFGYNRGKQEAEVQIAELKKENELLKQRIMNMNNHPELVKDSAYWLRVGISP